MLSLEKLGIFAHEPMQVVCGQSRAVPARVTGVLSGRGGGGTPEDASGKDAEVSLQKPENRRRTLVAMGKKRGHSEG